MTDLLPVIQADRDAVQDFHRTMAARLLADINNPDRPKLGEDEGDAGTLVQAFARHRLSTRQQPEAGREGEAREVARIIRWIDQAVERTKRHGNTEGVWLFASQWRTVRDILAAARLAAHSDDLAVDTFAAKMKAKLACARDKGRGGWDDPAQCSPEKLSAMLHDHVAKGDPIDVANFAMMIEHYGSRITTRLAVPTGVGREEVAETLALDAERMAGECTDRELASQLHAHAAGIRRGALLSHAEAGGVEVSVETLREWYTAAWAMWISTIDDDGDDDGGATPQHLREMEAMLPASPAAVAGGEA